MESSAHQPQKISNKKYGFAKSERLCNKKDIELLLKEAKTFKAFPISARYLWTDSEGKFYAQVLISVPKRNFKRAVKRNLLKRRIREAYRLNKKILYDIPFPDNKKLLISFVYNDKELADFNAIQSKIILTLQHIVTGERNK